MTLQPPSITRFRCVVRDILRSQPEHDRRDVVVLALDGVTHELAARCWPGAEPLRMRSVFPTTSSSAWLSALTGMDVAQHGVPGVVFRGEGRGLINVYEHQQALGIPAEGTVFTDAQAAGYLPLALTGDFAGVSCGWLDALLQGARRVQGHRFYAQQAWPAPQAMAAAVEAAVRAALGARGTRPVFVWCFIEVDRMIHQQGYSDEVIEAVAAMGQLARRLAEQGMAVVAHSDHGLVRTRHNEGIEACLNGLSARFGVELGGAGRTRWVYAPASSQDRIRDWLERELGSCVRICPANEVFGSFGLARARVGELVLIAQGEQFVTFDGHAFDHGSALEDEVHVPLAVWDGSGHYHARPWSTESVR